MERKGLRKGFLTAEAGMVLPVFLVAVLTLGCLMKAMSAEGTLVHVMVNQARRISVEAGLNSLDISELPSGLGDVAEIALSVHETESFLDGRIRKQLQDDQMNTAEIQLIEYQYGYREKGMDGLIGAAVNMKTEIPLPAMFVNSIQRQQAVVFRGFIGISASGQRKEYSDMELDEERKIVWVFPRAGERYHQESCSVIKVVAKEEVLTKSLLKQYDPCKLCKPESGALGGLVYCFPSSGTSFHRSDCHSVSRYVERMNRDDAEIRGYTACKVCGG